MHPSILTPELSTLQHEWLRGARARLLRVARIARREAVLELGAGHGLAVEELAERCGHSVTAVDVCQDLVSAIQLRCGNAVRAVCADACDLPFGAESFDLVFAQFAFLWFEDTDRALAEACRVLRPGGTLVAIEPDYEGMIEYPVDLGLRRWWIAALRSAGACPHIGRRLAYGVPRQGLATDVFLSDRLNSVEPTCIDFLAPLVEAGEASRDFEKIRRRLGEDQVVVHLPLFMLHGTKPRR